MVNGYVRGQSDLRALSLLEELKEILFDYKTAFWPVRENFFEREILSDNKKGGLTRVNEQ